MSRLLQPGQLWLYRTKPRDDELFSSWLVRLAHGLAIKLQSFSVRILGMHAGFWTDDVDRDPNPVAVERLSVGTAVPAEQLLAMGLRAYEGLLWEAYHQRGSLTWVMPTGRYGRRRNGYGQQYCRRCLMEDDEPYFRRRWRLAFNTVCERHAIFLDDACRACGAPVEFHAGDFGKRLIDLDCPLVRCATCTADFRTKSNKSDLAAPMELLAFTSRLGAALRDGWSTFLPGAAIYSFLAFDGLRYVVALLCSRSRGGRLRALMLERDGKLALEASATRIGPVFEELRVGDRAEILLWCQTLLRDWPGEFVQSCRDAQVSSSYILRYKREMPYWLRSAVEWHLRDEDYAPTELERLAVRSWLAKMGLPVTNNSTRRWLGLSHCRRIGEPTLEFRTRWNRRGPNKTITS